MQKVGGDISEDIFGSDLLWLDGYTVSVYREPMIQSFADATTADLWEERNSKAARRVPRELWPIVHRKLTRLDSAQRLEDLAAVPGNRLEALAGDRKGQHSIRVNQQYGSLSGGRNTMRTMSAARTTTESIPRDASVGPAVHPGRSSSRSF
jgi:proteic killer suppression protein